MVELTALVREAGAVIRAGFLAGPVSAEAKNEFGDAVTPLDLQAESILVDGLRRLHPDDGIWSEERGGDEVGTRWLVDPLDGSNNVALGLPLYGVCLTRLRDERPQAAIIHDAHLDRTAVAVEGEGATLDGTPLALAAPGPLKTATVSWFQGHGVSREDPVARDLFGSLNRRCKRVLRTWSPSIDWLLVAQGRIGAVVAYRNELEDLLCGCLLVVEAGGVVHTDGDVVIAGAPAIVAELTA
jgi:myo-inositol-1(or 4)-monophosphatase